MIIGAGGFGREVAWLVEEINQRKPTWNLLGFVDEDETKWGQVLNGYPVLGGFDALGNVSIPVKVISAVCVVGDPLAKKRLVEKAEDVGLQFVNLIHPEVRLSPWVEMGHGIVICTGCVVTVNIQIADHVSINPGCGIGHDTTIGAYTTLMWHVNLSGATRVGEGVTLGSKVTLLPGKSVGDWTIVGAGAVVNRDLPQHCTAVGVPAKPIKFHANHQSALAGALDQGETINT